MNLGEFNQLEFNQDVLTVVVGRISRYHDLDGMGGFGQQTFNPME